MCDGFPLPHTTHKEIGRRHRHLRLELARGIGSFSIKDNFHIARQIKEYARILGFTSHHTCLYNIRDVVNSVYTSTPFMKPTAPKI